MFKNRIEAGKQLAKALSAYQNHKECVVLGLPRGGVVLAGVIAEDLNLPLDVLVPRKIGAPDNPELAIGAITEDGIGFLDERYIQAYGIDESYLETQIQAEREEAARRIELYRGESSKVQLKGKELILVDDGIATGFTMKAAIASVKAAHPAKIVVAAPVGAKETVEEIIRIADDVIVLDAPYDFRAVSQFYEEFEQTTDEEVIEILKQQRAGR